MKYSLNRSLVAGLTFLLSLLPQQVAVAEHGGEPDSLPLEELRVFAEVFGRIKQDYVEPVSDKKLLNLAEWARNDIGDYNRIGKNARFFDPQPQRPDIVKWLNK